MSQLEIFKRHFEYRGYGFDVSIHAERKIERVHYRANVDLLKDGGATATEGGQFHEVEGQFPTVDAAFAAGEQLGKLIVDEQIEALDRIRERLGAKD